MPYKLVKKGGKLQLRKEGMLLAKDTTVARAHKQMAAIEISKLKRGKGGEMKERHQYMKDMGGHHPAYSKKYLM
tara:strand:+ start:4 stop:225 length:222 start_codon:yes stop_codon:yes gene_type:complete